MTEIVHVTTPTADPLSGIEKVWKFAVRIAETEFVPQAFRKRPDAIMAAIQFGRELGIGPMQSLQSIDVIQGKPTLSAEAMRARVFAAGHTITTEAYTDAECVLVGTRKDGTTDTVKFTMDDARRAGLTGKDSWKKYPRSMLFARATSELCRMLFPDVLSSASYTMEELGEDVPPEPPQDVIQVESEVVEATPGLAPPREAANVTATPTPPCETDADLDPDPAPRDAATDPAPGPTPMVRPRPRGVKP